MVLAPWYQTCSEVTDMKRDRNSIKPYTTRVEDIDIVLATEATLLQAQEYVSACEHCSEDASITFDYLLDAITGCDPSITEYLMCRAAKCPDCFSRLTEKTRIVTR